MTTDGYGEKSTPLEVLLVDDSPGDIRLTREALLAVCPSIRFNVAIDGMEAMAFLKREGVHADAPRPDLTLLDLNMPRMDGREVLACIKKDDSLRTLPILILTTSDSDLDVAKSYQLHANAYVCKPQELSEFEALVRSIYDFWLTTAKLPLAQRS